MQMKHFASAALVLFAALAAHSSDAVKVACIGDSITYGLGLADRAKESCPAQLQKLLDEFEPGKYEVRNFGNSGRGIYCFRNHPQQLGGNHRKCPSHHFGRSHHFGTGAKRECCRSIERTENGLLGIPNLPSRLVAGSQPIGYRAQLCQKL